MIKHPLAYHIKITNHSVASTLVKLTNPTIIAAAEEKTLAEPKIYMFLYKYIKHKISNRIQNSSKYTKSDADKPIRL